MDKCICFYHDDLDGYCSAAIYYKALKEKGIIVDLQKVNHGEIEFLNEIKGYGIVTFVDFCPLESHLNTLLKNNNTILILDHHKTVVPIMEKFKGNKNISFEINLNRAGCSVVWDYFYSKQAPKVVKLVQDYDIWNWEFEDTEDFVNGMDLQLWRFKPNSNKWQNILNDEKEISKIIKIGSTITKYKEIYNYQLCQGLSYEVELMGHNILVCNAPKNNSKVFGERIKDYPFVAIYSHKEDKFMVSLYSVNDFDTTKISTLFGGGGHAGASGFRCEKLPWL